MGVSHFITHLDVRKFLISMIGLWFSLKIILRGIRLVPREIGKVGQQQNFQMCQAGLS